MGIFNLSDYSLTDQIRDMLDRDVYADDDTIIKYRDEDSSVTIYTRADNDKMHNSYDGYYRDGSLSISPHKTNSDYDSWNDSNDDDDDDSRSFSFF